MKTLQEQYNLIKEGKGHKDVFLKEAKNKFPNMINKAATYDQATHILKKRNVINENYIDMKPLNTIEGRAKESWETKFNQFINEAGEKSLNPIVNNDLKSNTKEQEEKVSADPNYKFEIENGSYGKYKNVSDGVENVASRNYDYSPKVDNINNVNAQELQVGIYAEVKNNPKLTLEEAQAKVIANLAKDPMHYVKNGQFGVDGLGYQTEAAGLGTPQVNDGNTYGGSGFSDKLKNADNNWQVVKEHVQNLISENYVVGSGNPNSLAAMSGEVINQMLKEEGLDDFETQAGMEPQPVDEESQYNDTIYSEEKEKDVEEARQAAIEASQEAAGMEEDKRPDYPDVDKDGDREESMEKALKDKKKKKMKKENIETKLAEIGKAAELTKMEAQLEFLHDHIDEKIERVNSINEDDNLKELVDKKKMKDMQREIKLLEKRKAKMEKIYEKSSGKKYQKQEMVDENE
tara:strand:- start:476 stop:1858 length:1383 start_codon:yes stop_codon:yes gene_type:complete